MSENNEAGKRGRGRPAGSTNTAKSDTEKGWRETLKNVSAFAQKAYRDIFADVIRAEDAAKVSDADLHTAKAAVINALDARERKAREELAAVEKDRANLETLAREKAQGNAKGKAELAKDGRANLENIAAALRLTTEQRAALEGQFLHARAQNAPAAVKSEPAA